MHFEAPAGDHKENGSEIDGPPFLVEGPVMADSNAVPSKLLVIVPGLAKTRAQSLVDKIRTEYPDYQVKLFQHGLHPFSVMRKLDESVSELAGTLRGLSGENEGDADRTTEVVMVGHSLGGILVRAAYLHALGRGRATRRDSEPDEWAKRVTRIVLLGSPNTGFRGTGLPGMWAWVYPFFAGLGSFAVECVHAGSFWIADLRLRWLDAMRPLHAAHPAGRDGAFIPPLIVQVYGLKDGMVAREDIDDSEYMPGTVSCHVSTGSHDQLVDLTDPATGEGRWLELEHAIFGQHDKRKAAKFDPPSSEPVYFLLHGIRASAYTNWIRDLTKTLQAAGPDPNARTAQAPRVVAPNYGFFSAFQFALRGTRRANIHNFLDYYLKEVLTHRPDGFSFIGHSNGTYMMANVMDNVPAVRFRRIMLAGSVLPPDFNWKKLFGRKQIGYYDDAGWHEGQVHNDRARKDGPVGILANGMSAFFPDVGAAGVVGFEGEEGSKVTTHDRTFPEGHGAALTDYSARGYPPRMAEIADFLVNGVPCKEPLDTSSEGFLRLSRVMPRIAVVVAILLLIGLVLAFIWLLGAVGMWPAIGIYAAALFILYVALRTV